MGSELKEVCVASIFSAALFFSGFGANAQQSKSVSPGAQMSPQQAITLAQQGRCRESIAGLKKAVVAQVPAETRKRAGVLGVRCSLDVDDRSATLNFISLLSREFDQDPDRTLG